jgi:hypothetical protein
MTVQRRMRIGLVALAVVGGAVLLCDSTAYARDCHSGYGSYHSGSSYYRSSHYGSLRSHRSHSLYHAPSVHYDRVYHPTFSHYTRSRGYHSHGHYDRVPHYVPGHYDRYHRGHIDLNSWYHH